jgi:hypothetical protein
MTLRHPRPSYQWRVDVAQQIPLQLLSFALMGRFALFLFAFLPQLARGLQPFGSRSPYDD